MLNLVYVVEMPTAAIRAFAILRPRTTHGWIWN